MTRSKKLILFKMKAYSQDLRERVIELYNTRLYTQKEIARILKLGRETVGAWIRRYINTGDFSSKQHCQTGRARRFDDRERVLQYGTVEKQLKIV